MSNIEFLAQLISKLSMSTLSLFPFHSFFKLGRQLFNSSINSLRCQGTLVPDFIRVRYGMGKCILRGIHLYRYIESSNNKELPVQLQLILNSRTCFYTWSFHIIPIAFDSAPWFLFHQINTTLVLLLLAPYDCSLLEK